MLDSHSFPDVGAIFREKLRKRVVKAHKPFLHQLEYRHGGKLLGDGSDIERSVPVDSGPGGHVRQAVALLEHDLVPFHHKNGCAGLPFREYSRAQTVYTGVGTLAASGNGSEGGKEKRKHLSHIHGIFLTCAKFTKFD